MTGMRTNREKNGALPMYRQKSSKSRKGVGQYRDSTARDRKNEADVLSMFQKYRIKCPTEKEKDPECLLNQKKNSAKCIRQNYCKGSKKTSVTMMRYPVTKKSKGLIRVPKFCSDDKRKSSAVCKQLEDKAKTLKAKYNEPEYMPKYIYNPY